MTPFAALRARRLFLAIVVGGIALRIVIMLSSKGSTFDIGNAQRMLDGLKVGGFDAYGLTTRAEWPYGPGYFPWLLACNVLDRWIPFDVAERLGATLADVGLMWLVQDLLGRAGRSDRTRLLAVAVLAFGPLSVAAGGWFGQLDPAAALLCVGAYWAWTKPRLAHRAVWAGVLLGAGWSVKTVPLLLLLPFAIDAKTRREAVTLIGTAVLVQAVVIVPFYLKTPEAVSAVGTYHGLPAFGGLGLVLRPFFAADVLSGRPVEVGSLLAFLRDHATAVFLVPALIVLGVLLRRRRIDLLTAVCLTWLTTYVFGVNFLLTYLGWAIPFFLIRGHIRAVAALQLAVLPMTLLLCRAFEHPSRTVILVFYSAVMFALWWVGAAILARWAYGAGASGEPVALADSPGTIDVS